VFGRNVEDLCAMFGVTPHRWAADAHPGYVTTRWAHDHATGPVLRVQHHHAHVAALMAEHGHDGASPVVGFSFDGTGYGAGPGGQAQIWGGEVLVADYGGYHRAGHLRALPLPGGDSAVRNPCRVAVAYMAALGIDLEGHVASVAACSDVEVRLLARQVAAGISCVPTTSMGRLFDTAASLLGVRHRITYEAQAAMELEALAAGSRADPLTPPWRFGLGSDLVMDPEPVLRGIISSSVAGADPADLVAYFHGAVALGVAGVATALRPRSGTHPVGLTGGVFQNALLTRLATTTLEAAGFEVLTHHLVPPNDGGLSLGQAVIAGYRRG